MAEKSLLSLREIAGELNLNYRTMVDIKNQFYSFLPNFFDGRNNKYLPDCVDFFRLIFALKEEGYTSMMIRQILMKRLELPEDNELKEWVMLYIEKYGSRWTEMEADGGRWTGMDEDGWGRVKMDGDGGKRTGMDDNEQGQIERDDDGWRWTQTEEDGGGRMDAEQLKEEVLDHIQSQHIAQLNSTITKLYQALTELQEATASINHRLARLESELNGQAGGEPEFSQLDLEELQVGSNPSAPTRYDHTDLEFVKASIQNGKPNKDAVLQWALAEKEKDPSVSFGHLAQVLDEAGVPTLSGRTGWNRAKLRNLLIKSSQ